MVSVVIDAPPAPTNVRVSVAESATISSSPLTDIVLNILLLLFNSVEIPVNPVPPFDTGKVPVTLEVKSIEPSNIAFVIPDAFTCKESELISIEVSSTFTFIVLPDLVNPSPPIICPAPEN